MTQFDKLLQLLAANQVEYIVIGGLAAAAHRSPRLTQDLDVVYRRTDENIARLCNALSTIHPYMRGAPPGLPFQFDPRTVKRGLNFTLTTDWGWLDVLGEVVGGGNFDALLPHTIEVSLLETRCRVLNLDKLIEVKRAAGRPKDIEAIAELEALRDERDKG